MGGWKLEVFKMSLYMSFPVTLFYYFNRPEYFEEWVTRTRREIYPPESAEQRRLFEDARREQNQRHAAQLLSALEASEAKAM